ncbi:MULTISPECIES: hypothetical protein [Pseudomonas]|uniref:Uncharacterized protein n=2 Tax=Pseudomonas TaxID=286 RepID=A0A8T8LYV4_PSESX|nr:MULTISPECIES: hypothetical protein [Pseudomonas]MEE4667160.1 hypothetical protein [Pseudomonas alliivorans]MBF7141956.1 hypothetical protein [Pseudomonas sp. LY10J]NJP00494.1 hypothetical protein [Pseudomonas quercus]PBP51587.1 hypothetical protein CCL18_26345 [Pseudomonas syringae]QUP66645.1 hypothetical protein PSYCIT7_002970 [Pseudomonas syringae Cit 7]
MRNSSSENVRNRLEWLEAVLNKKITINERVTLSLKTMRSFCALAIAGRFSSIAYNTLRNATMNLNEPAQGYQNWAYLVELRQRCFETFKVVELEHKESKVASKDKDSQALLYAHICSMAYLEIYQFLERLVSQPEEMSTLATTSIKNQLIISREKFKTIASYSGAQSKTGSILKLVDR